MASVTGVTSSTADGAYRAPRPISVQVNFSEIVNVTGTPQLTLETGAIDRVINYASGSGTNTLTFNYTVQAGDTSDDLDYVSTSALSLNGGAIKDAGGNNAILTLAAPGTAGSLAANKALVIDTTPPETLIVSGPQSPSNSIIATFVFSATEPATYQASVDGGAYSASTGSVIVLGDGAHTLQVKAADFAGNVDPTPATYMWVLDTMPPDTAITSGPSGSVSSTSAAFDFTNSEGYSTFEVSLDGAAFVAASGPVTFNGLAQGAHTFAVRAIDQGGNVDASPANRSWTVDTIAPDIPAFPALANDTGTAGDQVTSNPTITYPTPAAGDVLLYRLDSGSFSTTAPVLATDGSAEGQHTITITARDTAGNIGATSSLTFTLDTIVPATPAAPVLANDTGTAGDTITSDPTVLYPTPAAGDVLLYSADGGSFSTTAPVFATDGTADGQHTVSIQARDAAGNIGAASSLTFKLDTEPQAPAIPVFVGTPDNDSFTAAAGSAIYIGKGGIDKITFDFKLTDAIVRYSGNQVTIDSGSSNTVLNGFERFVFTDGTVDNTDGDRLVDDLFYYSHNHDVWNAHADADIHYNTTGWHEGRDPDAFFDTSIYLSSNPDVAASGVDPRAHYDTTGWKEGRVPSLEFDGRAYLDANPDVKAAHIDPLFHFLVVGAGEGRSPVKPTELATANGFDFVYYLANNPDVAAAGVDPFWHFQTTGWHEGRDPNAWFNTAGYLSVYTDVAAAHINPLDHYNASGWHEGRDPSLGFDTASYLAANSDVAAAQVNPLVHFLHAGHYEGRTAVADGTWG
jgi:hypothetical protein